MKALGGTENTAILSKLSQITRASVTFLISFSCPGVKLPGLISGPCS